MLPQLGFSEGLRMLIDFWYGCQLGSFSKQVRGF
jgi:hypothetical protein